MDLTEEEIIENLDTISRIYQDEISALTMLQIVSNVDLSENSVEARSTVTIDYGNGAFRHSIWNFVMCKEGWGRKEEKLSWANDFTTAHEKGIRYEKYSSEMDLHNNNVARLYFSNNSSDKYIKIFRWRIPCGVNSPSYEDACNELRKIAISANFISREDSDFFSKLEKIPNSELIYISEDKQSY